MSTGITQLKINQHDIDNTKKTLISHNTLHIISETNN